MTEDQNGPPAGWYPHPTMKDTQRYWEGDKWTDHVAPGIPDAWKPAAAPAAPQEYQGLVAAGILTAIFFPIVGFILGFVIAGKPNKAGTGIFTILLSTVAMAVYYQVALN